MRRPALAARMPRPMTREHKLALVVGFGLILFVGILVSDHLAADTRGHDGLPSASIEIEAPITSLALVDARVPLTEPEATQAPPPIQPEIVLARPMSPLQSNGRIASQRDPLAGRGMTTPPAPRERTHVVRRGETLSGIAKRFYGDAGRWKRIANANPGIDADRLRTGATLRIPAEADTVGPARRTAAREVPAAAPDTRNYTVRSGDSLARIARRQLGKESRWREIVRLNGLPNEVVVPGQVLTLPVS